MKPLEGKVTAKDLILKLNELIDCHNNLVSKMKQIDEEVGLIVDAVYGETAPGSLDS